MESAVVPETRICDLGYLRYLYSRIEPRALIDSERIWSDFPQRKRNTVTAHQSHVLSGCTKSTPVQGKASVARSAPWGLPPALTV